MKLAFLAINLFGKKEGVLQAAEKSTVLSPEELLLAILLKFVDVLEGVGIIILGLFASRYVRHYFQKIEAAHERQKTALNLLEKITTGFVLVIAFMLGLKLIGIDLTLIISVLTLGLSFGLRDVIKNYVAGLLILFKSPFEIGDIVRIRNFTGYIEKIEFQSTTMRTFDNKEITIHNSDILTQPIVNFSKNQQRRLEVTVSLGYGTDVGRALKIFERVLENHPAVLKTPKYSVVFKEFMNTAMQVLIRFWVQRPCNPLRIRSNIALQFQEAIDEDKIFAPFAREAGLDGMYGMSEMRKERIKIFYAQPFLLDLMSQTAAQVAATVTEEQYADAEEPE